MFELYLATKYFFGKKNDKFVSLISFFSLLGVIIGVAALIVVMSVMNGFRADLISKIRGLGSDIMLASHSSNAVIEEETKLTSKLQANSNIIDIHYLIEGQAFLTSHMGSSGAIIKGFRLTDLAKKPLIIRGAKEGSFEDFRGEEVIAIGQELAATLGVRVGDTVKLMVPNLGHTILGSLPRSKTYLVSTIFSTGMYDYDSLTVLMPFTGASQLLKTQNHPNILEIFIDNPDNSTQVLRQLSYSLSNQYRLIDWKTQNMSWLSALKVESSVMFVILSLIIIVAAFNIISSQIMLVKDKAAEIAMLRTLGASKSSIVAVFFCMGSFIGVIGTSMGVILGYLIANNLESIRQFLEQNLNINLFEAAIYFLYELPSKVYIEDIIGISSISLLLCMAASIYPAYKAASINPIEALKNE